MAKPASSQEHRTRVRVEFDRHLVAVIGSEHYPSAEYLFGELAANAYDADATEVRFQYDFGHDEGGYKLMVEDNGNGMTLDELENYFRFGAQGKKTQRTSKVLKRPLIGQFGLGKVSALKAARQWFLTTEHERKRYFIDVDFGSWMDDDEVSGFVVEPRPATGKNGTRIELVGVHVRSFREDGVVRAIRRLPISSKFKVYVNGRLIPPRAWDGIDHYDINLPVKIGERKTERITGRIWINKEALPIDEGKEILKDPPTLQMVLDQDLDSVAGVEVKVHGATIVREFFEKKTSAHGVNFLWGYVHADWLPVVANRTDFVRDSPEGQAFYRAMYDQFGEIYREWRAQETVRASLKARAKIAKTSKKLAKGTIETTGDVPDAVRKKTERYLGEVGVRVQALFDSEPDLTPFLGVPPPVRPGRPSDRIRPLYEFEAVPSKTGDEVGPSFDYSVADRKVESKTTAVKARKARGRPLARVGSAAADPEGDSQTVIQPLSNIALQLQIADDGPKDAAFRWGKDPRGGTILYVNMNYPLHRLAVGRAEAHRLYLGLTVALALAEQRWNVIQRQGINDYILDLVRQSMAPGVD